MVELEFVKRDGTDLLTIPNDDVVSLNATLTNTGVATINATISGNRKLERRVQRQDRINVNTNGGTKVAGYVYNIEQARSQGTSRIQAKGIAKQLQEGRPDTRPIVYDNVFAGDAIEDYWSRTPFGNVTVTKQDPTIVVQDSLTQSADTQTEWNNQVTIPNDVPVIIENGKLKQVQSGFVREAENVAGPSSSGTASNVSYSSGEGALVTDQGGSGGTVIDFDISPQYDINNAIFAARGEQTGDDITFIVNLDGSAVASYSGGSLGWQQSSTFSVSSGTHRVTVEIDFIESSNSEEVFDVVAILDNNYTYNFDNTVDSDNGHLDGPALYPTDANPIITTAPTETTRNIAEATVKTTYNDTSNDQRLGLSDDGGATFGRANNTNSFTATFSDAGRQLVTEFRLSGYDNGARNATPRFNYLGQTVDSFETTVDLDDRVVFVGVEVSKNHFENLQKLHSSSSDYIWTIDHDNSDVATMPVFSFPRGEETRTLDQINEREIDESPAVEGEQFYNVIPLEGGLRDDGTRPFAEVKDQDSINNIGTEISPGLLRDPTISSDIEARFIAQALLKKAVANGQLRGTKTIPPTFAPTPGFAYPVSWLDDPTREVTLEEVSVTKSGNSAETTLDFKGRTGFAQQIDELNRKARETQDKI